MNSILLVGTITVTLALIAYSLFVFTKPKQGFLTLKVVIIQSLGLLFDITATILMISGSQNTSITLHGVIGYSALAVMVIETIIIWKHWSTHKQAEPLSKGFINYTWIAYSWWVIAFVAGGMLAASNYS